MAALLIIDDERSIRHTLRDILEFENYQIDEAADGAEGLEKILHNKYEIVLCDVKMPKMDGIEVLEKATEAGVEAAFIMISGHANIDLAVEATKKGAYDFIEKPPDLNRLLLSIRNALDKTHLVRETRTLKRKAGRVREMIGESTAMLAIKETIARVAPTEARVLITGENGTGKELVARWIHEGSKRAARPIVEVNCAAIPSELIESELFGHEKGSFTGAVKQRLGKFEQADGGTLFLDEIGDMSPSAQAKVLRALQESKITRVGGEKDISVNVRVIAATNKDLLREAAKGTFREDLYHRLSVVPIHLPPLRERPGDAVRLAEHFLNELCAEYGYAPKRLTPEAAQALGRYKWTGNVRELRNVVERLVIFCDKSVTETDVLQYAGPTVRLDGENALFEKFDTLQEAADFAERGFIQARLIKNNWNINKTAEELDIDRNRLANKLEKYGLAREEN